MTDTENNKRDTLDSFLAEGMVLVQLDSRLDDVCVPEHLKGDPTLRLNISGRFGLPLEVDDWGVRATLTFQGDPFECQLPWKAIYIIISHVTGEPCLFASDVPPEYVSEALGHLKNKATPLAQPQPQPEPAADPEPNRMHLRLVHDEPESAEPTSEPEVAVEDNDDGPDDDGPAPPPKKPFLSVVK
ncbi:MAG: stringent starvation protein B [Deltaproteobacteria bacterium]|nr:stringent starvation protein B [Deltaproteobacteria bacterium]